MKILSCEDHDLLRDGLHQVLEALPGSPTLLESATAAEALAILEREGDVALVLLDLGLPDVDGLDLLSQLRERHPATGVAVFSGSTRASDVRAALDRGAQGYIPKTASRAELLSALERVLAGEVFVPDELRRAAEAIASTQLTPRQAEVAELLVRGLTNPEIGELLGIHVGTVKKNVEAILETLEVSNRTEAVLALVERGLVAPPRDGS
ncbi:MAG: response regulator [Myxococcota bacterium]